MDFFKDVILNDDMSAEEKVNIFREVLSDSEKTMTLIFRGELKKYLMESDIKMCKKECEAFFTTIIWNELEEKSKEDLTLAFFFSNFNKMIEDDESTPICKYAKTIENEIKIKLVIPFLGRYSSKPYSNSNKTSRLVNSCIDSMIHSGFTLSLGQMLHLIKESSSIHCIEYALDLKNYINCAGSIWNNTLFYSKSSENYYISYTDEFRNNSAHAYEYDSNKTLECKNKTKEILLWFIGALL